LIFGEGQAQGQSADRLDGFQADFALVLGSSFADPDHAAAHGRERVWIEDNFHHLAASQMETSAQPKPVFGGIEDEARESFLVSVEIDD